MDRRKKKRLCETGKRTERESERKRESRSKVSE